MATSQLWVLEPDCTDFSRHLTPEASPPHFHVRPCREIRPTYQRADSWTRSGSSVRRRVNSMQRTTRRPLPRGCGAFRARSGFKEPWSTQVAELPRYAIAPGSPPAATRRFHVGRGLTCSAGSLALAVGATTISIGEFKNSNRRQLTSSSFLLHSASSLNYMIGVGTPGVTVQLFLPGLGRSPSSLLRITLESRQRLVLRSVLLPSYPAPLGTVLSPDRRPYTAGA